MSRLTSEPFRRKPDDSLENYKVRRYGREEWETAAQNAINKLGKLEDLMQEYTINSIEQLENILSSKVIVGGSRSGGKSIVAKGMLYNKLSEELGCPLEVVFKAIDKGIKTKKHYDLGSGQEFKEYIEIVEPHLTFTSVGLDWLDENEYFQDYANKWCFHFKDYRYIENEENDEYECLVKLSDYQKTWWLKGEENGRDGN